jgi:flagellar basal-body rod protein FlgB
MQLFTDTTTSAIEWALAAQTERQRVISHNVANVNTPGFRAQRLDFEQSLGRALRRENVGRAEWTTTNAGGRVGLNGNDVNLEDETQALMKSSLHYDALVQAMNFKLGALRTAIGRR